MITRERTYRANNKKTLAVAYGFAQTRSLVDRIRSKVDGLSDEDTLLLGQWTGNGILLPQQVEIIVKMLGTPSLPDLVYSEKRIIE